MADHERIARLDGPIHGWFSLSYSNYLVLHRTLMQSMPVDWQRRAVALFDEMDAAFAHLDKAQGYIVHPAREVEYGELTDAELEAAGVARYQQDDGDETSYIYEDSDGIQREEWERVLVPIGEDPVPHYNRGRTYIEPREATRG